MSKGLEITFEVADGITLCNLIECRERLQEEIDRWTENPRSEDNPDGYWLHPEDVGNNLKMIVHLNAVIKYFGGD
jgi:hypothetical protein